MKRITERLQKSGSDCIGIFHDSRKDVRTIAEYCNLLADKINELNEEVQQLAERLKEE